MSREEVKTAINKLMEKTPENVLMEIYEYLSSMEGISSKKKALSKNLRKILAEEKELLERLAQ